MIEILDTFKDVNCKVFHTITNPITIGYVYGTNSNLNQYKYWAYLKHDDITMFKCLQMSIWYENSYPKASVGDFLISDLEYKKLHNKQFNEKLLNIINE